MVSFLACSSIDKHNLMHGISTSRDDCPCVCRSLCTHGLRSRPHQLLKAGASINDIDTSNRTMLHVAASFCHLRMVIFLLLKGADPHEHDNMGQTALHLVGAHCASTTGATTAAANHEAKRDIALHLVKHGARVMAQSATGQTPLELALGRRDELVALAMLVGSGTRESQSFKECGASLLHTATALGLHSAVKYLVKEGEY